MTRLLNINKTVTKYTSIKDNKFQRMFGFLNYAPYSLLQGTFNDTVFKIPLISFVINIFLITFKER